MLGMQNKDPRIRHHWYIAIAKASHLSPPAWLGVSMQHFRDRGKGGGGGALHMSRKVVGSDSAGGRLERVLPNQLLARTQGLTCFPPGNLNIISSKAYELQEVRPHRPG